MSANQAAYTSPTMQTFPPPPTQADGPGPSFKPGPSNPRPQATPGSVVEQMPGPAFDSAPRPLATSNDSNADLQGAKSAVEFTLREYMSLQRRHPTTGKVETAEWLRMQAGPVLTNLRALRKQVAAIASAAESHRWRRWLVGGILATFIPAVRAIFRRPKEEAETSNDTEYAFRKSKSLIDRILDSARPRGLASMAFFVFAVLYVFQNEVTLRIARGMVRRLRRLSDKIEEGSEAVTEKDVNLLNGWRWRILFVT